MTPECLDVDNDYTVKQNLNEGVEYLMGFDAKITDDTMNMRNFAFIIGIDNAGELIPTGRLVGL